MRKGSRIDAEMPSQPVLPGCRLYDLARESGVRVCDCARGVGVSGFIFCEDAPWVCPRSVPPVSNTGVHALGSAAASEETSFRSQTPKDEQDPK